MPVCEMKISSWPSLTTREPARPPFLAVIFTVEHALPLVP